jgi:hypothetical protein
MQPWVTRVNSCATGASKFAGRKPLLKLKGYSNRQGVHVGAAPQAGAPSSHHIERLPAARSAHIRNRTAAVSAPGEALRTSRLRLAYLVSTLIRLAVSPQSDDRQRSRLHTPLPEEIRTPDSRRSVPGRKAAPRSSNVP